MEAFTWIRYRSHDTSSKHLKYPPTGKSNTRKPHQSTSYLDEIDQIKKPASAPIHWPNPQHPLAQHHSARHLLGQQPRFATGAWHIPLQDLVSIYAYIGIEGLYRGVHLFESIYVYIYICLYFWHRKGPRKNDTLISLFLSPIIKEKEPLSCIFLLLEGGSPDPSTVWYSQPHKLQNKIPSTNFQ